MSSPGAIYGSVIGPARELARAAGGNLVTYTMTALNTGWCARFIALSTLDIKSVKIVWSGVAVAGTMTLRVETIDATTGKPTGTLYDASAVITGIVPGSAGSTSTYTFGTLPTAGLTAGTAYGVVILTTVASTFLQINSHIVMNIASLYPVCVLTAADGTTRSNFAEVSQADPTLTFVMEDDTEETLGCCPSTGGVQQPIYLLLAVAQKVTLARSEFVYGVAVTAFLKTGTPAGDLRVRILDATDAVVSGTTVTMDKDYLLTGASSNGVTAIFPVPVKLAAGAYRVVFDSQSSAGNTNCWAILAANMISSGAVPSAFRLSTTSDVTAVPIVWTDSTIYINSVNLLLDSQPLGLLVHPGMQGGARG